MPHVLAALVLTVLYALPSRGKDVECSKCISEISSILADEGSTGTIQRALSLDMALLVAETRTQKSMENICRISSLGCPEECLAKEGWVYHVERIGKICTRFSHSGFPPDFFYFMSLSPCLDSMTENWKSTCRSVSDHAQNLAKNFEESSGAKEEVSTAKELCQTIENLAKCETMVFNTTCASPDKVSVQQETQSDDRRRLLLIWRLIGNEEVMKSVQDRIGRDLPSPCSAIAANMEEFLVKYQPGIELTTPSPAPAPPTTKRTTTTTSTTTTSTTTTPTTTTPTTTTSTTTTTTTSTTPKPPPPTTTMPTTTEPIDTTTNREATAKGGNAEARISTKPNSANRFSSAVILGAICLAGVLFV